MSADRMEDVVLGWEEATMYDLRFTAEDREATLRAVAEVISRYSDTESVDPAHIARFRWVLGQLRDCQPYRIYVPKGDT